MCAGFLNRCCEQKNNIEAIYLSLNSTLFLGTIRALTLCRPPEFLYVDN
jgi:hypothetical protein